MERLSSSKGVDPRSLYFSSTLPNIDTMADSDSLRTPSLTANSDFMITKRDESSFAAQHDVVDDWTISPSGRKAQRQTSTSTATTVSSVSSGSSGSIVNSNEIVEFGVPGGSVQEKIHVFEAAKQKQTKVFQPPIFGADETVEPYDPFMNEWFEKSMTEMSVFEAEDPFGVFDEKDDTKVDGRNHSAARATTDPATAVAIDQFLHKSAPGLLDFYFDSCSAKLDAYGEEEDEEEEEEEEAKVARETTNGKFNLDNVQQPSAPRPLAEQRLHGSFEFSEPSWGGEIGPNMSPPDVINAKKDDVSDNRSGRRSVKANNKQNFRKDSREASWRRLTSRFYKSTGDLNFDPTRDLAPSTPPVSPPPALKAKCSAKVLLDSPTINVKTAKPSSTWTMRGGIRKRDPNTSESRTSPRRTQHDKAFTPPSEKEKRKLFSLRDMTPMSPSRRNMSPGKARVVIGELPLGSSPIALSPEGRHSKRELSLSPRKKRILKIKASQLKAIGITSEDLKNMSSEELERNIKERIIDAEDNISSHSRGSLVEKRLKELGLEEKERGRASSRRDSSEQERGDSKRELRRSRRSRSRPKDQEREPSRGERRASRSSSRSKKEGTRRSSSGLDRSGHSARTSKSERSRSRSSKRRESEDSTEVRSPRSKSSRSRSDSKVRSSDIHVPSSIELTSPTPREIEKEANEADRFPDEFTSPIRSPKPRKGVIETEKTSSRTSSPRRSPRTVSGKGKVKVSSTHTTPSPRARGVDSGITLSPRTARPDISRSDQGEQQQQQDPPESRKPPGPTISGIFREVGIDPLMVKVLEEKGLTISQHKRSLA